MYVAGGPHVTMFKKEFMEKNRALLILRSLARVSKPFLI